MSMLLMSTLRLTKLNNRKSKLLKKLLVIEIMNWELSKLSHQLQLMSQRLQSKLSQYKIRPPQPNQSLTKLLSLSLLIKHNLLSKKNISISIIRSIVRNLQIPYLLSLSQLRMLLRHLLNLRMLPQLLLNLLKMPQQLSQSQQRMLQLLSLNQQRMPQPQPNQLLTILLPPNSIRRNTRTRKLLMISLPNSQLDLLSLPNLTKMIFTK